MKRPWQLVDQSGNILYEHAERSEVFSNSKMRVHPNLLTIRPKPRQGFSGKAKREWYELAQGREAGS